jgi:phage recombination protein Bet
MSNNALDTLTTKLAEKLEFGANNAGELVAALKDTAFKGQVSDAQMTALMVVANQYGLNPWTREIYAFPDKGGIVPIVGVDGWARIINSNPQFDGMEFKTEEDGGKLKSCSCTIYRKDRNHPVTVTEFFIECRRDTSPWKTHPSRMLRHKAMIQAARLAFGYVGIFDQDEAEVIVSSSGAVIDGTTGEIVMEPRPLPPYPEERLVASLPKWAGKNADDVLAMIGSKYTVSAEQEARVRAALAPKPAQMSEDAAAFVREMEEEIA